MVRKINWKLIIVLMIGLVVLGITVYGLRKWNRLHRAESSLEDGNKAYDNAKWHEAAENLGRYLAVESEDVDALLRYAQAQLNIRPLKRDNILRAVNAYRRVLRIDKTYKEAAMMLIEIYMQLNTHGEAELIARQQLETSPDSSIQIMLAKALLKQRKFTEAADELKAVIRDDPTEVSAYDSLGQLAELRPEDFAVNGEYWFNEAVKNNPSSAQAYIIRGAFYLRHGQLNKALADLAQAEKYDLSDTLVRLILAREFVNAGDFDRAGSHLEAVYETQPDNALLWHIWAMLAYKNGSKDEMRQVAQKGLKELSSNSLVFMPTAAELFIRSGDLGNGAHCIDELKQKEVGSTTVAYLEGLMAEQKGQWAEAVRCWRRTMELGLQSENIQLAMASALVQVGDRQSALSQLRSFTSKNDGSYRGHLDFAKLLVEAGKWPEAAEQAREVLQLKPDSVEGRLVYLRARMQLLARGEIRDDTVMWENIENDLAKLQKNGADALMVKLLMVRSAVLRRQLDRAGQLVDELQRDYPSKIQVALARIDVLIARDEIDDAVKRLRDIVKAFPESMTAVQYLVGLLARQGKLVECENLITEIISQASQSMNKRKLQLMLVDIYTERDEKDKAYQLLESMARTMPDDIPIKRRLLDYSQAMNKTADQQRLVDEIKSIEGENGWQWRFEQAKLWFRSDNFKEYYPQIVSLLRDNILSNPDDQTSRRLLAASYERAGELQLAISSYLDILNRAPDDVEMIISTVSAMYKTEEYERADEILARAARGKLSDPRLSNLELYSFLRQGRLDPASEILEQFLAKTPENSNMQFSLALLRIQQDRLEEARELLDPLLHQNPDSLSIVSQLVELNIRQSKNEEALKLCDEMVNRVDSSAAYILRGKTYARLGQIPLAKEDMEKAAAMEPDNVNILVLKSNLYHSAGQLDKAINAINKAMEIAPENLQVQKQAIITLLATGKQEIVQQGSKVLDKALASNPDDIELRFYKVQNLLLKGMKPSIEEAVRILERITEEYPRTERSWAMLSDIYLKQADIAKAMDFALRGLSYQSNSKLLMLAKARCETARSPIHAIPTLKALLDMYPDDVGVVIPLADTYVVTGQYPEAIELLKSRLASAKGADTRKINIALAVALYEGGDIELAEEKFAMLYKEQPDDSATVLAHAQVLGKNRRWPELADRVLGWYKSHPKDIGALLSILQGLAMGQENGARQAVESILRVVIDIDPDCVDAVSSLGVLLHASGNSADAADIYERVLKLDPDRLTALNNLAWILCAEQGECERSLELVKRGLAKNPYYVDLIDTRGIVLYQLGRYDRAVEDFTKCTKLYPRRAPAVVGSYFHLGQALQQLKRNSEAIINLKKSLELNMQIGGLSPENKAQAQRLLTELSEKYNHVPISN
jgi:tetratricopeptide (TPR) repeat protein